MLVSQYARAYDAGLRAMLAQYTWIGKLPLHEEAETLIVAVGVPLLLFAVTVWQRVCGTTCVLPC